MSLSPSEKSYFSELGHQVLAMHPLKQVGVLAAAAGVDLPSN
jgi:hypothetical protein